MIMYSGEVQKITHRVVLLYFSRDRDTAMFAEACGRITAPSFSPSACGNEVCHSFMKSRDAVFGSLHWFKCCDCAGIPVQSYTNQLGTRPRPRNLTTPFPKEPP